MLENIEGKTQIRVLSSCLVVHELLSFCSPFGVVGVVVVGGVVVVVGGVVGDVVVGVVVEKM